jgi:uncharacterized RmlC-like cupin family protein
MTDTGTPQQPRAVAADRRSVRPEQQTPSIRREEAFSAPDRWIGYITTQPGEWSGWHHHGEQDTYFYVMQGGIEFEYGTDGEHVAIDVGEFGYMPHGVIHRERTAPGDPTQAILVRIGPGPSVINVDGPG